MARARLNDTRAIAERPSDGGESHSIHTRKIDNGYLVTQSSCNPRTGEFRTSEAYQETPPRVIPGRVARGASPDNKGLRDTMEYLSDGE